MSLIEGAISMIGVQEKIFGRKEKEKPNTLIKMINHPEDFKLTAWIEGETMFIRISRKEQDFYEDV